MQTPFEHFISRARESAWPFAVKLSGGNKDDAEDLIQTALVKAFRSWKTYHPPKPCDKVFRAWFRKVVLSCWIDLPGRVHKSRTVSLEAYVGQDDDCDLEEAIAGGIGVERSVTGILDWERCLKMMDTLPSTWRHALVCAAFSSIPQADQAKRAGVERSTWANWISNGRRRLAELMVDGA
jgi:RNA polymerase sigma factor (sigma-70 family)